MIKCSSLVLFLSTSSIAVMSASYRPCELCTTRASPTVLSSISIRLYPNTTINDYITVPVENASSLISRMNSTRPTVIYVSGWTENTNSTSVVIVLGAYLKRQDHNVMLIDYYDIAAQIYTYAVLSVNGVGYTVAKGLNDLVAVGLNPSTLHVVGHSLGGQVAAYIGRYANFTLDRITGLDPAGPGFDLFGEHLSSKDARFVDVIHTDAGHYGSNGSLGNLNCYPNGGSRVQPGCPNFRIPLGDEDFCDHHRSWYYYAESLVNEGAFVGVECASYTSFKRGFCASNRKVVIGFGTSTNVSGNYYLQTNSESPFGRGMEGANVEASASSIASILPSGNRFPSSRCNST